MDRISTTAIVELDNQVGGHKGVLSSEDGSVIVKPCLPHEVEFYTTLSSNEAYAHLRPFVPKFYGTLKLQGKLDEQGNIGEAEGEDTGKDEPSHLLCRRFCTSLVLQNLTHTFAKPNVLDIKLGTILWDAEASPEKRARMEKTARETTSFETGVRLTGFNVYDHTEGKPVNTPKSYGKSIKPADLPVGVAKFFPLAASDVPTGQGLPKDTLQQVLKGIVSEIKAIRSALQTTEIRMVGGSILVVYEADWDILRQSLESWSSDGGDAEGDEDMDEDSDETAESDEEEEEPKNRPPYLVKLIDFAHTSMRQGEGPDLGVIRGLDTTIKLLAGRLEEVSRREA